MATRGIIGTVVLALLGLPGCSSDDDDGNPAASLALMLGLAVKGQVANATANVYALQPTGTKGRLLGSGETDANGGFQIGVDYSGWAVTEIFGGTTTDFRGVQGSIPAEYPLLGLRKVERGQTTDFGATILSTIAFLMLKGEIVRGVPFKDAIYNVEYRLANLFGFPDVRDVAFAAPDESILFGRRPQLLTQGSLSESPEANYGAVTDGFCEMAILLGIAEMELAYLVGADLLDGLLDGQSFGRGIVSSGGTTLPDNTLNSLWPQAISNLLASQFNQSGLTDNQIPAINSLQAAAALLTIAPILATVHPDYARVGQDETITLRGFGLPSATNAQIKVGGASVDADDISDGPGGLQFNLRAALAVQWTDGRADVKVKDTTTGLLASAPISALDTGLQPAVRWFGPVVAASSGGTRIEITGQNLYAGTTALVDSQPAEVVADGAPHKIVVATPPLAPGNYSLMLSNGQGTTTAGTVEVRDVDLTADETETDNEPQLGFALQVGFNPDKFVSGLRFEYDWQNADAGTSQVMRHTISESSPTVNEEVLSGVGAFRSRCGNMETVLNDSDDINFFIRQNRNDAVRAGNGPDALTFGWAKPTDVTRATVAGSHYVVLQQWDFEQGFQRYMYGTLHLDEGGVGSMTLWCRERALDTAIESVDILCGSFDWDIGSDGKLDWTPRGFSPFALDAYFSGNGHAGIGMGRMGNSLIFANTVRMGRGQGLDSMLGSWGGSRHQERVEPNFTETRISVEHKLNSFHTIGIAGLDFSSVVTRDSEDTKDRFDRRLGVSGTLADDRGLLRNKATGAIVGANFREDGFGLRLEGGIDLSDDSMFYGGQVFEPNYQTDLSLNGLYGGFRLTAQFAGDGSSASSSTSEFALHDYDASADPQSGSGYVFDLAGTATPTQRDGQTIDRDVGRNVTINPFSVTDGASLSYAFVGRELVKFRLDPHVFLESGAASPSGNAVVASDGGGGASSIKSAYYRLAQQGVVDLDGDFRIGTIEKGYDLFNGDLNLTIQDWSSATFDGGSFSASGSRFDAFEDGSTDSGGTTASGSFTTNADGITELDLGGPFFFLVPHPDGQSFLGTNVDETGRQTVIVGTKFQPSAPDIGNFRSLRLGYSFGSFAPFPPEFFTSSGVLKESLLGPGQITLTDAIADRSNQASGVDLFQQFNTFDVTYGSDGAATVTEGGSTRSGGGAPTTGYDFDADLTDPRVVRFGVRFRF